MKEWIWMNKKWMNNGTSEWMTELSCHMIEWVYFINDLVRKKKRFLDALTSEHFGQHQ